MGKGALELLLGAGSVVRAGPTDGGLLAADAARVAELVALTEVNDVPVGVLPLSDPGGERRCALELRDGSLLIPPREEGRPPVETGPVLRSVVLQASQPQRDAAATARASEVPLPGGWTLTNASRDLARHAAEVAQRCASGRSEPGTDFAHTAYYMGSKRALLPFLMEPLADWVPGDAVFVDLMCGSGAVAGAAARRWDTVASDAQAFCRVLAGVQSGGYSHERAIAAVDAVRNDALANAEWLVERLQSALALEDSLLHATGEHEETARSFRRFVEEFPTYPNAGVWHDWQPTTEVLKRRVADPFAMPSCLFTTYFANVYLGLRQAIEIDSLRHGIAKLESEQDKRWALGALVAAVSATSTSYAGHFAQPYAAGERLDNPAMMRRVIASRSMSVFREFEVRLLALATASEGIAHETHLVDGPWQHALDEVGRTVGKRSVVVFVDAPYRRDEYSRYYHVLETLVTYQYPEAGGRAKLPNKKRGERFASEFFTRSPTKMRTALTDVIGDVLRHEWKCAWTYSDTADAAVNDVLSNLTIAPSRASAVATKYAYNRQGRYSKHREVAEYLIMLEP